MLLNVLKAWITIMNCSDIIYPTILDTWRDWADYTFGRKLITTILCRTDRTFWFVAIKVDFENLSHALASTLALKLALGMFLFSHFCHVNWVTEFVASNWCVHYLAGSGKWLFPMAEASDRCEPFFHTLISAKSAYLLVSLLVMSLTIKEMYLNFL